MPTIQPSTSGFSALPSTRSCSGARRDVRPVRTRRAAAGRRAVARAAPLGARSRRSWPRRGSAGAITRAGLRTRRHRVEPAHRAPPSYGDRNDYPPTTMSSTSTTPPPRGSSARPPRHAEQRQVAAVRRHAVAWRGVAEQDRERAAASATTGGRRHGGAPRGAPSGSPGAARADPQRPSAVRVERPDGTKVSITAIVIASSRRFGARSRPPSRGRAPAPRPASGRRRGRARCGGRTRGRPAGRAGAASPGLRPAEAIRQSSSCSRISRGLAPGTARSGPREPQLGELRRELRRQAPPRIPGSGSSGGGAQPRRRLGRARAHALRERPAGARRSSCAAPPAGVRERDGRADRDGVGVGDGAVTVVADR